jgi:hypothetical protein
LDNLRLRIDAGARPVTETIPDDLGEVTHELIVALQLIGYFIMKQIVNIEV